MTATFHPNLLRQRSCVLVIDVVESVRLIQSNERAAIQHWLAIVEGVRRKLSEGKPGRIIKSLGDGMLMQFDTVPNALDIAFGCMTAAREMNRTLPEEERLHLRMGIEVTDVLVGDMDIYGHGVNLAARLAGLSKPGEIVVSADVRDEITADIDADIEDMGECFLKHIEEPVRAYRLREPGHQPVLLSAGSLAAMLPTIAIIPFESHGTAVVGEILAEELIRALSQSDRVNVISRLSTRAFRNTQMSPREIGKLLKTNYIMHGSCHDLGGRMIFALELTDAKSGAVIWADRRESSLDEILLGDQEMVARLVGDIGRAILKREFERARTMPLQTVESYGLLIGAIASMYRLSQADFNRAGEMLEHLIDREPRQPLPLAWHGNWHVLKVQQGWTEDVDKERRLAQACTNRALDLDAENAEALTIDGFVQTNLSRDFDAAEDRYDRALVSNPNASMAWLLKGMMHAFRGEGLQAVEYSTRAQNLSPIDPQKFFYDSLTSGALIAAGDYDGAEQSALRSLKANATHTSTLRMLAIAQWERGKYDEARATVRKLMVLEPDLTIDRWVRQNPSARFPLGKRLGEVLANAGVPR